MPLLPRKINIIVHGVPETSPNQGNEEDNKDADFMKNLVDDLHVSAHVKYLARIGKFDRQKNRPIKVSFGNEKEKISVLQSLCNLKEYEGYKGISITDDFTPSERGMIKEWSEKAKKKNENENDESIIWRVRGSPKNGLFLKKFQTKKATK